MLLILTAFGSPLTAAEGEIIDRCIARMSSGDTEALAQVYERTHAALYGFSLFLLKNAQDAEDAVQETFVKAYQSASQYRSEGKPMAWLMTIARNESFKLLRERRRTVAMTPEDWQEQFSDRPDFSQEDLLTLRALLETLSDEERQIVSLHALGGLKHREIADMLELALPTVLSKYHRAMKKLGKAAEEAE